MTLFCLTFANLGKDGDERAGAGFSYFISSSNNRFGTILVVSCTLAFTVRSSHARPSLFIFEMPGYSRQDRKLF